MSWSDISSGLEIGFARVMFKADTNGRRRLWLKLAKLISHGVQLLSALASIRKLRLESGGKSHPETFALNEWSSRLNDGQPLSKAMAGWIPDAERMLIAAGEASGTMEKALESSARVLQARTKINGAVLGGIAYPAVLLVATFAVMYLFGFKIVPAFTTGALKNAHWTGMALAMINVSTFIRAWLWLIVILFAASVTAFSTTLPYFDGPVRTWLDRYSPYSIYRVIQGSTWLIAMSAMVEAGVRIESALSQLSANASPWLRKRLDACAFEMSSGLNMGDALARTGYEFPDREIINDMATYAAMGNFDEALLILGKEWLEDAVDQIKRRMAMVFGICILVLGGMIGFMVSGLIAMELQLSVAMQTQFR